MCHRAEEMAIEQSLADMKFFTENDDLIKSTLMITI